MKSSLKKLRGFALHHHHHHDGGRERKESHSHHHHHPPAKQDELVQASQDMRDMKNCYDNLLSAAAATANCAYEFAEALRELGTCLLEKTALNNDEDSDGILLMLGKAQFELHKLLDSYRGHITQTITTPSESLLKELQTVEEMKQQCDDKRDLYKFMLAAQKEKGRSRNVKGENFSSQQLQAAQEDYEEEATLFVFRLKSLKQGQSRSLLTQAARHHAAQLSFFRKALKSLEVIEPHIKVVAEHQHIDYQFSGLEDDTEDDDDDYDYSYDGNDDGELSFDYGQHDHGQDVISISRNSMEFDTQTPATESAHEPLDRSESEYMISSRRPSVGSQSAPIFADYKYELSDKIKEMRPSSRKFHTYVLPTPLDAKNLAPASFGSSISASRVVSKNGFPTQLWYSSPLEPKLSKDFKDGELSSLTRPMKMQMIDKESSIKSGPIKMPPPLTEVLSVPRLSTYATDNRKYKRHAFSGPITGKTGSNKPMYTSSVEYSHAERSFMSRPSVSPRISPNASPSAASSMSSPKINELHQLPRPPTSLERVGRRTRPSSLIGYSAPLLPRGQEHQTGGRMPAMASHTASPLPTPPTAMARSFSIPSSTQRMPILTATNLLEAPHRQQRIEEVSSPPLLPISLNNIHPASAESVSQATKS